MKLTESIKERYIKLHVDIETKLIPYIGNLIADIILLGPKYVDVVYINNVGSISELSYRYDTTGIRGGLTRILPTYRYKGDGKFRNLIHVKVSTFMNIIEQLEKQLDEFCILPRRFQFTRQDEGKLFPILGDYNFPFHKIKNFILRLDLENSPTLNTLCRVNSIHLTHYVRALYEIEEHLKGAVSAKEIQELESIRLYVWRKASVVGNYFTYSYNEKGEVLIEQC